jgi:Zn-dependent protease with chaperone function
VVYALGVNIRILSVVLFVAFSLAFCASLARGQEQPQTKSTARQGTTLTPEQYTRAKNYSRERYSHYFAGQAYGFVILALLLVWQVGPRLQRTVQKVSSRPFFQLLVFAPLFIVILSLLLLPVDLWDHALSLRYGLSIQNWGSWFSDWLKSAVLSLLLGTLLIWILYAVIRRSASRWWLYFWLASIPVVLLVVFVSPAIIDPMFFKFEPLEPKNPQLVSEIERVVQRAEMDIPPDRMFEMNASSKYTGLNAFVEGVGSTKRVVVWDTMLQKADVPQTLVVFGHEMGHYVLLHIPKQIAIDSTIALFLLYAGFQIVKFLLANGRWNIRNEGELASLPLLILVFSALAFVSSPVFAGISRHFEHEADRYALEVTHGIVPDASQAGVRFFELSGVTNLSDPDPSPFIVFWLFDHPSDPDRIRFMKTYDPWSNGHLPRYVK